MEENIDILKESDYIWIYSDGMTADEPIDKIKFSSLKQKVTGVYLGDSASIQDWEEYFDNIVVEPTLEKIAEKFRELIG
jgi:intein-encoded DNA endonuclease-like protein